MTSAVQLLDQQTLTRKILGGSVSHIWPRRVWRFVQYLTTVDESAAPEFDAVCVTGDEEDCGAYSGVKSDAESVERWMDKHLQSHPGHNRFRRSYGDYVVKVPMDDGHRP